jgi:hypothetical protein
MVASFPKASTFYKLKNQNNIGKFQFLLTFNDRLKDLYSELNLDKLQDFKDCSYFYNPFAEWKESSFAFKGLRTLNDVSVDGDMEKGEIQDRIESQWCWRY